MKIQLVALAMLLAGCAQSAVPVTSLPDIESFRMSRTACLGTCPDYSVEIFKDGSVKYSGHHFVGVVGDRDGKVDAASFEKLRAELAKLDYFALKNDYYNETHGCAETPTDMPSANFTAKTATGSKDVSYYYGCHIKGLSEQLQRLSDTVDEVANSKQWVAPR